MLTERWKGKSTVEKEVEAGWVRRVRTPFIYAMQCQQATMRGSSCLMFRLFLPPHSVVHCAHTSIVFFQCLMATPREFLPLGDRAMPATGSPTHVHVAHNAYSRQRCK